jgi:hypothetical protein
MKRLHSTVLAVAAIAFVVSACEHRGGHRHGMMREATTRPDPRLVRIFVDIVEGEERLLVDQEPVHARSDQGKKTISFLIDDPAKYTFPSKPSDGISICLRPSTKSCTDEVKAPCTGGGPVLQCRYDPPPKPPVPTKPTIYLYQVTVINKETGKAITLDPSIMN